MTKSTSELFTFTQTNICKETLSMVNSAADTLAGVEMTTAWNQMVGFPYVDIDYKITSVNDICDMTCDLKSASDSNA